MIDFIKNMIFTMRNKQKSLDVYLNISKKYSLKLFIIKIIILNGLSDKKTDFNYIQVNFTISKLILNL